MGHQDVPKDKVIAGIAGEAHGVVSREELLRAHVTPKEIRTRRARGSLIDVFRGVYRVGHKAPSTEATYMAAVKAAGPRAAICGRAAAHHLGLIRGAPPPPEVASPTNHRLTGVKTRRIRLHASEVTTRNRIPTTTPARTLVDLAGTLEPLLLSRVVHEAVVRYGLTAGQIELVLRRNPRAKGGKTLKAILTGDERTTLSTLEANFLRVLDQADLPLPETNRKTNGRYVDCRWPAHKLTVELDSFRFHNTRHSWQRDLDRERKAYARGDQFRRYSWRDVVEDPRQMLRELRALLPT